MLETLELFGSPKKLIEKARNGENLPCLEVVKVVLVQYNLVDNKYQESLKYYTLLHQINLMIIC